VLILAFWIKSKLTAGCVAGQSATGCFAWGSGSFSLKF
jgi:hypothetical protein